MIQQRDMFKENEESSLKIEHFPVKFDNNYEFDIDVVEIKKENLEFALNSLMKMRVIKLDDKEC